eukprot:scaffold1051_cov119-Cylindrotheca_fusiformis.AAC.34
MAFVFLQHTTISTKCSFAEELERGTVIAGKFAILRLTSNELLLSRRLTLEMTRIVRCDLSGVPRKAKDSRL